MRRLFIYNDLQHIEGRLLFIFFAYSLISICFHFITVAYILFRKVSHLKLTQHDKATRYTTYYF